ncbi:nucleotide-binding universal stress UspA family protein [Halarchaeum rubridurum]|uniref:Nucleotide-binding universal stress UspA family protein n=1 Tax=Halarchaeum rubridurum TaxID=489911 RepID=A0A830FNY9_9EURY|nr:universal stress protein [Halarchaeum rubridurum]MBP1953968.1 nucleotide-binding universal stress UspA family protein [Halarchaeum rubridurum]GGM56267.1 universal stress protein UspA [Halarchaeum rubridurum]
MYDTVLVPTDGSDTAGEGVDHALDLAAAHDATVRALSVAAPGLEAAAVDGGGSVRSTTGAARTASERAARRVADAAEERGLDATCAVERGVPHRVIRSHVRRHDVDVVVMGTHGRTGIARALTGSVTERVIRRADVPVVTVRERA